MFTSLVGLGAHSLVFFRLLIATHFGLAYWLPDWLWARGKWTLAYEVPEALIELCADTGHMERPNRRMAMLCFWSCSL